MLYFFLFRQKTAYEMRISDWSSDVCSSDLEQPPLPPDSVPMMRWFWSSNPEPDDPCSVVPLAQRTPQLFTLNLPRPSRPSPVIWTSSTFCAACVYVLIRSEEHTSELQSLMRISYAVFCLTKTITTTTTTHHSTQ